MLSFAPLGRLPEAELHGSAWYGYQRVVDPTVRSQPFCVAATHLPTRPAQPLTHVTARVADTPAWPPALVENLVGSSWALAGDDAALLFLGTLLLAARSGPLRKWMLASKA